jgi:hypothetical protein
MDLAVEDGHGRPGSPAGRWLAAAPLGSAVDLAGAR